jgi:hypothetical protein
MLIMKNEKKVSALQKKQEEEGWEPQDSVFNYKLFEELEIFTKTWNRKK